MHEDERLENILEILRRQKAVSNDKLCQLLFCSQSTLRRDLLKLEASGQVKRSRGRVSLITGNNAFSFFARENINIAEKKYIAELASDYVADSMALFLDNSSTTYQLCSHLENKSLIVVTNSLKTAVNLNYQDKITCFTPGGHVKNNSAAVVGEMAIEFFKNFNANICFISCRGISEQGLYEADLNQAMVKKSMIANSKKTILLMDDSKYDNEHFFKLAGYEAIHAVVTNKAPNETYAKIFYKFGLDLAF